MLKQLLRDLYLATQAFWHKGRSGRVSMDWKLSELERYEAEARKAGGLY
jgi:hypothetical protein